MLKLLIKLFIKDSENVKDPVVRGKYGVLCGGYGIFLNVLLFTGKYIAGLISGSVAMTADAFNNLSDACSSIISIVGFKLAGKEPDPEHPFGHGRIEYITGLGVAAMIVIMGYELITDSVSKIINPQDVEFSIVAIVILLTSILVKVYMAVYTKRIGKKIDSKTLYATSTDSLSDTITTSVVLITTLIAHFFNIKLDGFAGLFVGVLIIIAGIQAAKDTLEPLLGAPPSEEFVRNVERIVMEQENIVGIHDMIVHDYGPGRVMISLHAEVPNDRDINELHDSIDIAENNLRKELKCDAVIHMDPIVVGDPVVDELKRFVVTCVKSIDASISIHDFRVVSGPTHTNLVFDVLVPYRIKETNEELSAKIQAKVSEEHENYFCVLNVDRDYTSSQAK